MPVIKNQLAGSFAKDAIVLDMSDLRRQADRLLDAAKAQAQRLLEDASAEAKSLSIKAEAAAKASGHAQGLAQGLEEGRKAGHAEALAKSQAQFQQLQQAWLAAAQSWDQQRVQMDREARQAILQVALIFAEKVVRRVVQVDDTVVVDQLAQALAYVMRPTDVTVRIHPSDRPALEEAMPQLMAGLPQLGHVHLTDDDTLTRGGCFVQYGEGRVDATIETQLSQLADLMIPADELRSPASGGIAPVVGAVADDALASAPDASDDADAHDENAGAS